MFKLFLNINDLSLTITKDIENELTFNPAYMFLDEGRKRRLRNVADSYYEDNFIPEERRRLIEA